MSQKSRRKDAFVCDDKAFLALPDMHYDVHEIMPRSSAPLMLQVIVDTEEEFDWFSPPRRDARKVSHFSQLHRFQALCERYNVNPCYVVDHPVATDDFSIKVLKPWVERGVCEIGAHLHPWVNPPYTEALAFSNMYPGNLPAETEFEKIAVLTDVIEKNLGVRPCAYKSGRYGFGPHTAINLMRLGFDVDLSFSPAFDMREDGGPDHSTIPVNPFMIGGAEHKILTLPGTGAVIGAMPHWFNWGKRYEHFKIPAVFSRLKLADQLKLSPEGFTSKEHVALTRALLKNGVRLFSLTLHSSSLMPGGSPYAKKPEDVELLLERCERYFDFFFNALGGTPTTPSAFKQTLVGV